MGCFDSIIFKCPNCGEEIEAQSKSGECALMEFNHNSVPFSVAEDANRHAPFLCSCGSSWIFGNVPGGNDERISLSIIEQ